MVWRRKESKTILRCIQCKNSGYNLCGICNFKTLIKQSFYNNMTSKIPVEGLQRGIRWLRIEIPKIVYGKRYKSTHRHQRMDLSVSSKIIFGDGRMKHIINFSGGKDSTAMLIRMIEEGMHIDDIVFIKVEQNRCAIACQSYA